jgi:hypothetical protein
MKLRDDLEAAELLFIENATTLAKSSPPIEHREKKRTYPGKTVSFAEDNQIFQYQKDTPYDPIENEEDYQNTMPRFVV